MALIPMPNTKRCVTTGHSPALLAAARAIWDRGRIGGKEFNELSEFQRADLIADAAAALKSLLGSDKRVDRVILAILGTEHSA